MCHWTAKDHSRAVPFRDGTVSAHGPTLAASVPHAIEVPLDVPLDCWDQSVPFHFTMVPSPPTAQHLSALIPPRRRASQRRRRTAGTSPFRSISRWCPRATGPERWQRPFPTPKSQSQVPLDCGDQPVPFHFTVVPPLPPHVGGIGSPRAIGASSKCPWTAGPNLFRSILRWCP